MRREASKTALKVKGNPAAGLLPQGLRTSGAVCAG
jgi:hypothetical protein